MKFRQKELEVAFLPPNLDSSGRVSGDSDAILRRMTSDGGDFAIPGDGVKPRTIAGGCAVEGQLCTTLPGNSVTLNDKIGNLNVGT